jgi:DNA-binding response OmpR family regulator
MTVPALMTLQKRRLCGAVRPTALIVDGESLYRWFVSEALGARGMHVVQCRTVAEAADFLNRRLPADLLIVDAQTLRDEGKPAMETLDRVSSALPCLLLDSSHFDRHPLPDRDIAVVDKPVDSDALFALVEARLHGAAPPAHGFNDHLA